MPEPMSFKNLELEVSNFGPIEEAKIDLRPLTVFAGPSNTGKSYLAMLVYALHRFFGGKAAAPDFGFRHSPPYVFSRTRRRMGRRVRDDQQIAHADIENLLSWAKEVSSVDRRGFSTGFPIGLPESVANLVISHLKGVSDFADALGAEIERCFGIEDTKNLVRYRTSNGAQVAVRPKISDASAEIFEYEFTISDGKYELALSTPNTVTLSLMADDIRGWPLGNYGRNVEEREYLAHELITELSEKIDSSIFSPLARNSYYLPADRAGVMHSHRVVVNSLIERAPYAGLQRGEPLPALSGVLADFLGQLIQLDDSPRRRGPGNRQGNGTVARRLEQEILKGAVKRRESVVGYPTFSYQPSGWEKDLPMMNTSSMVSELAPVVLYLRHVVRPGETLIIEEPESHLHPAAQVEFIRQLAGAVRSGVRIMLTTHSEWVLEELANLVRMSELPESKRAGIPGAEFALSPDEVGAWLFEPQPSPDGVVVREIKLDVDSGVFPVGFGNITQDIYNRWAEIDSRINENRANG